MNSSFEAPEKVAALSLIRTLFMIALFGAAVLPLLPIWEGGLILISGAAGVLQLRTHKQVTTISFLGGCLILFYLIGWTQVFTEDPIGMVIGSLTDISGHPTTVLSSAALFVLNTGIFGLLLSVHLRGDPITTGPLGRVFVLTIAAFVIWILLGLAWQLTVDGAVYSGGKIPQLLTTSAKWVFWAIIALAAALLFHTPRTGSALIAIVFGAAIFIAVSIIVLTIAGDFSYILPVRQLGDEFSRVRASYYYHAPATQFILIGLTLSLALPALDKRPVLFALSFSLLGCALYLNSTRALALAYLGGAIVYAVLILLFTGRKIFVEYGTILRLICVGLLTGVMVGEVFYVKETLGTGTSDLPRVAYSLDSVVVQPINPVDRSRSDASTGIEDVISSNSMRASLAEEGLKSVEHAPVFGGGPGVTEIFVRQSGGTTISSHMLAIDIAAQRGVPALIFVGFALLLSLWVIASSGLTAGASSATFYAGCFATLATFFISTLFHPLERSMIIPIALTLTGVFFALAIRGAPLHDASLAATWSFNRRQIGIAVALITSMHIGWLIVASPSAGFPAIEFLARFSSSLSRQNEIVYVNSRALKHAVTAGAKLLRLNVRVELLDDNPNTLPAKRGWILWDPAKEPKYPEIRRYLGFATLPRYGQFMGNEVPAEWRLLDSYQPTVQFFHAGPEVGPDGLTKYWPDIAPNALISSNAGNAILLISDFVQETWYAWNRFDTLIVSYLFNSNDRYPMAYYSLDFASDSIADLGPPDSWEISVSLDGKFWTSLGEQSLPKGYDSVAESVFLPLPTDKPYLGYRLTFPADGNSATDRVVSEIGLYPVFVAPDE